ncbi:NosD domain-containing protein [Candidatus Altiarchaeota archaeon]
MNVRVLACLIVFLLSSFVGGIECGQVMPQSNVTLDGDLNCGGFGIRVEMGSEFLDCVGHTITGNGSAYGIYGNNTNGLTIRNCIVSGFERGISLLSADNDTLLNNTVFNNTYGIVIQRSMINNLSGNNISNNQQTGLYIDNVSAGTDIDGNTLCSNNLGGGPYYDIHNDGPTIDVDIYPKIFEHVGLDIEPYNETTMLAGGVIFDHGWNATHIDENRVFIEFGIARGQYGPNAERAFHMHTDANVYAPVNGTIANIGNNTHSNDYGLMIYATGLGSEYLIGVDHVLNVTVAQGDNVTAGQVIAKPGYLSIMNVSWGNDPMHHGQYFGLVEYSIVRYNFYLCPTTFYTDELFDSFNQSILQLMAEWEEFIGDPNVHNESAFVLPGCLMEELPFIETTNPNSGSGNTCSSSYSYNDTNESSGCTNTCLGVTTTTSTSTTTSSSTTSTSSTSTTSICPGGSECFNFQGGWNLVALSLTP